MIRSHAKRKLEAAVAEKKGKKKKKRKEKERRNTCRTIEDGLSSAFDSK